MLVPRCDNIIVAQIHSRLAHVDSSRDGVVGLNQLVIFQTNGINSVNLNEIPDLLSLTHYTRHHLGFRKIFGAEVKAMSRVARGSDTVAKQFTQLVRYTFRRLFHGHARNHCIIGLHSRKTNLVGIPNFGLSLMFHATKIRKIKKD